MRHRPLLSLLLIVTILTVATATGFAHHLPPGMEDVDEFTDNASFLMGFHHPLTGFDHLIVALLTGWLAARLTGWPCRALIPMAMLALAAGALAPALGFKLPSMEAALLASVVLSVVVISLQSSGALRSGAVLLVLFQLWQGSAHTLEAPARVGMSFYIAGVCTAAALTMVTGWSLSLLAKRHMPGMVAGAQPA